MTIMIMRGGFAITIFACAFTLSGCGGGGGGPSLDAASEGIKVEGEGWGFSWSTGADDKSSKVKLRRDKNDNITRLEIDGHVFNQNCFDDVGLSQCEDAKGNKGFISDLIEYDYLVTANWVEKGEKWPTKAYVVADIHDRTPSNVKISGSYKGKAEILVAPNNGNRYTASGVLNLTINDNKVSGTVQNFRKDPYGSNRSLSGRFDINGSVSGNRLSASFGGNLNGEEIVRSKSRMEGGFFGPKGEEVGGGLSSETKKGTLIRGLWHAKK